MHSEWSVLHARLVRSVNRHPNLAAFRDISTRTPTLRRFSHPTQLLDWLHGRTGSPEEKNVALKALLQRAGAVGGTGTLAVELLILALWPGLTAVRRRLWLIAGGDDLDGELVSRLSVAIATADPDRARAVAASLLRNIERDVRRARMRHAPEVCVDYAIDDRAIADRPRLADDQLAVRMVRMLGADGDLLARIHIAGWSQKEAAEHLGISHAAARKRYQRAMARLREIDEV